MKAIIQRVKSAQVDIEGKTVGKIGNGFLILLGVRQGISNFTLYADCSHGRRPSFIAAARPETAEPLYEYFCGVVSGNDIHVEKGVFGADMQVSLINDGPVTIDIDTKDLKI